MLGKMESAMAAAIRSILGTCSSDSIGQIVCSLISGANEASGLRDATQVEGFHSETFTVKTLFSCQSKKVTASA